MLFAFSGSRKCSAYFSPLTYLLYTRSDVNKLVTAGLLNKASSDIQPIRLLSLSHLGNTHTLEGIGGYSGCWTMCMSHTHTYLYQRFKVLFSEVVTSATSQQPHKPCCIVMAIVCHSEHGNNKAPNKHTMYCKLNIRSMSSCLRACFMF